MPKKLRDYLLEGGIKGKRFADPHYLSGGVIYEVERIDILGKPEETWGTVTGRIIKPKTSDSYYSKVLDKCLNHERVR